MEVLTMENIVKQAVIVQVNVLAGLTRMAHVFLKANALMPALAVFPVMKNLKCLVRQHLQIAMENALELK